MLTTLVIRDVVLIETLDLAVGPGMTALTGETGAGKSIILDALGLATGARAIVITIPDMGLSPYAGNANKTNPGASALLSRLTTDFNGFLRTRINATAYDGRNYGLVLADDIVAAIVEGRRPQGLDQELSLIWDFVTEVQRTRRVSDTTYGRALARFGEQGVIDLAGIIGYYSLLALTMNVARVAPPQGESYLPRFPE